MPHENPALWAMVHELQRAASAPVLSDRVFGLEHALDEVVERIVRGQAVDARVIKNLCSNRAATARARRRLARRFTWWVAPSPAPEAVLAVKSAVDEVRGMLRPEDYDLLHELAEEPYACLARARGASEGTLKARASRLRAHLRSRLGRRG